MGLIGSALVEGVPMVTAFSRFVFGGEARKNKKKGVSEFSSFLQTGPS